MDSRQYVYVGALGSAAAAAAFLVVLDNSLQAERWGPVAAAGALFGLFMATWNGVLIRLDSRQRTTRNIVLEHYLAELTGVMAVAWILLESLAHLRWPELAGYTVGGVLMAGLVALVTRRDVTGETADELFA